MSLLVKHHMPVRRMCVYALHLSSASQTCKAKVFDCVLQIISALRGEASLAQIIVTKGVLVFLH